MNLIDRDKIRYVRNIAGIGTAYQHEIERIPVVKCEVKINYGYWMKVDRRPKSYKRLCSNCAKTAYAVKEELEICPHCGSIMTYTAPFNSHEYDASAQQYD